MSEIYICDNFSINLNNLNGEIDDNLYLRRLLKGNIINH